MRARLLTDNSHTLKDELFDVKDNDLLNISEFLNNPINSENVVILPQYVEPFKKEFAQLNGNFLCKKLKQVINTHILIISELSANDVTSLNLMFNNAIVIPPQNVLPIEELLEVLHHKEPQNYAIGLRIDTSLGMVMIVRGDLSMLTVPCATFAPKSQNKSRSSKVESYTKGNPDKDNNSNDRKQQTPDFSKPTLTDHGQTIKFGTYEASMDALLYEFDADYRKSAKQKFATKDRSFGACLRRLRIQKNLRQTDFPQIDPREIGRIERSEVTPRKSTIEYLAITLGVSPEEIASF